ncbi:MAG TPA: hypothetical protein VF796_14675 [Humisphaera sp.]
MKIWTSVLAAVVAIGILGAGDAQAAAKAKKDKKAGTAGVIQKIEGNAPTLTITIAAGKGKKAAGGTTTITTDASTAVTADGQAKTLKDLHVGSQVKVTAGKGGAASSIEVSPAGAKKKDPAAPKKPKKAK